MSKKTEGFAPNENASAGKGEGDFSSYSVKRLRRAAERGNAVAQFYLGLRYSNGVGVPQDNATAMKWWRRAAAQGLKEAQYNLGCVYHSGDAGTQDHAKAMKWWLRAAKQGNPNAQYCLGGVYVNGYGVPKDEAEAVRWYRLAAEQGHAKAQYSVGVSYDEAQDYAEAMRWYRLAAEQGNMDAQSNIGSMYANGKGVPKDEAEAVRWIRPAAQHGHAHAQYTLGVMYADGRGVSKDDAEAVQWYRRAAKHGHADARFNLGVMYADGRGVPQSDAEATKWYQLAAEQMQAGAQCNLGIMYANGRGVPQDDAEAKKWWLLAADQGNAVAQYNLGVMYIRGTSVPQDHTEAVRWFRLAAKQGDENARGGLITAYLQKHDYRVAYDEALRAATAVPRLKSMDPRIYIAHQIASPDIEGPDDEGRVAFFRVFVNLYKAVDEIRSKLFCGQAEDGGDEFAHYTSLSVMQSLVASGGRFRLYNAGQMRDSTEGKVFFETIGRHSEKHGVADCQARFYPDFEAASKEKTPPSPAYIGSFVRAEAGDDGNKDSEVMWNSYGKQAGGACLIFDRKKFAKTAPSQIGEMFNEISRIDETLRSGDGQSVSLPTEPERPTEPALYRIIYESECDAELGDELKQLADALKGVEAALANTGSPDATAKLRPLVRELLDSVRFLFKANDYKWEKEMRVVDMRYGAEVKNDGSVKIDRDRVPPRFYLELDEGFRCREIIIGRNAERYREWKLHLQHDDESVTVRRSEILIRP